MWNVPFVGHRTGFTERTAIAVELFLSDATNSKQLETLDDPVAAAQNKQGRMYKIDNLQQTRSTMEEQV